MKVEFFPAAETELLQAAKEYEALFSGLGSDFLLEVERLTSVLVGCLLSERSSIQYTVGLHSAAFHMRSSSAVTVMSFVSSRWRIEDAGRSTGSLASKIADKLLEPTLRTNAAQQSRYSSMKSKLALIAVAVVFLSGCSTASIYEKVSEQLVEMRYTSICCGHVGYWRPLDKTSSGGMSLSSKELTKVQGEVLETSLEECISLLSAESIGVNAAMATSQLIECMRAKGWSHALSDFATMS